MSNPGTEQWLHTALNLVLGWLFGYVLSQIIYSLSGRNYSGGQHQKRPFGQNKGGQS